MVELRAGAAKGGDVEKKLFQRVWNKRVELKEVRERASARSGKFKWL